jgi:hypothetical protein
MEKKNLIIIVVTHFLSYKKNQETNRKRKYKNPKIQNDIHEEIPKNCPS